jgi:hypothetical protein
MTFQFEIQNFQTEAAESVVRVFAGYPNVVGSRYRRDIGSEGGDKRRRAHCPPWAYTYFVLRTFRSNGE